MTVSSIPETPETQDVTPTTKLFVASDSFLDGVNKILSGFGEPQPGDPPLAAPPIRTLDLDAGQVGLPNSIDIIFTQVQELVSQFVYKLGPDIDGVVVDGDDDVSFQGNALANLVRLNAGDNFGTGGEGDDTVSGGAGNDFIASTSGADSLSGDEGNDIVYGGTGNDTVTGGDGDDFLYGESESDSLTGGAGNDFLDGGSESDSLSGGAGNDSLIGGSGNDSLTGGAGEDVFIFGPASGNDQIVDFTPGVDIIEIAGSDQTIAEIVAAADVSGGDTVISLAGGTTITVQGVTGVDDDWFIIS